MPADSLNAKSLDATTLDTDLPSCSGSAALYAIGVDEQPFALTAGASLPVAQGFQGFLFVRVGMTSAVPLPDAVRLGVQVTLDNGIEVILPPAPVKVSSTAGEHKTGFLALYFNDWPLPQLIGRKAQVQVVALTEACALKASVEVGLSMGAFMSADAGFWADAE